MFFFWMDPKDVPIFGPGLGRLETATNLLREVDPGMPIGAASTLIHISRRLPQIVGGTLSLKDVSAEMGMAYPTFLRNTDLLSDGATGVRSLGLMEKGLSPTDRRARQVRLTNKGLDLLNHLSEICEK